MFTKLSLTIIASNLALSAAASNFVYNSCQPASVITASGFTATNSNLFNSLGSCGTNCEGFEFIALRNTQCLWPHTFTSTAPASESNCNSPCPGYPAQTCGGEDFFSVYALAGSSPAGSNSTSISSVSTTAVTTTSVSTTAANTATSSSAATGVSGNGTSKNSTSAISASGTSTPSPSVVITNGANGMVVERLGWLGMVAGSMIFL